LTPPSKPCAKAAEGRIALAQASGKAVLVEINSETDFVAKDDNFVAFCEAVAAAAVLSANDIDVIAKVGENVQVRRLVRIDSEATVAGYLHGGKIGVLIELKGGDAELARGLAMHVAAMNPPYNKQSDVPADFVEKEKEIELAKLSDKDKSKPAEIQEKIIGGKLAKIVNEISLYGQPYALDTEPYALDTDKSVEAVLKAAGAEVVRFNRLVVGEGIEKVVEDYAAEVAKAMQV